MQREPLELSLGCACMLENWSPLHSPLTAAPKSLHNLSIKFGGFPPDRLLRSTNLGRLRLVFCQSRLAPTQSGHRRSGFAENWSNLRERRVCTALRSCSEETCSRASVGGNVSGGQRGGECFEYLVAASAALPGSFRVNHGASGILCSGQTWKAPTRSAGRSARARRSFARGSGWASLGLTRTEDDRPRTASIDDR